MNHIRVIARTPHPIGSEPNRKTRDYLVAQLSSLGLDPQVYPAMGLDVVGTAIGAGNTQDIVGYLRGSATSRAILLVAHYDSVSRSPGGADDGSGVAVILETVRALRAVGELKNDLMVLFSDGEESGLLGAEAFATSHPWVKNVGLVLNFEARGDRGASLMFETSPGNQQLINNVVEAAPYPVASSLFYELYKKLPNDTDFTVFRRMGIPGLNFAFGAGFQSYHSRLDTPEHLSTASVQHQGSYALALTRHFGGMDLTSLKQQSGDDVFFNWVGGHLMAYSEKWVVPGQTILTVLIVGLIVISSKVQLRRLSLAALLIIAFLVLISGILILIWEVAGYFLANKIMNADIPGDALVLTGMILFGMAAAGPLFRILRNKFSCQEMSLAGLGLLCIFNWIFAVKLAAGSYLLFWPSLFAVIGLLVIRLLKKDQVETWQWVAGLAPVASALLLFVLVIYLVYVFFSLQLLVIIIVGSAIGLLYLLSPQLMDALTPRHKPLRMSLVLWGVGLICCIWGGIVSSPNSEHPGPDTLAYSLDANDGTGRWISYDIRLDQWTNQFFPSPQREHQPLPDFLAGSSRPVFSAPTAAFNLPAPIATVLSDEADGEIHRLHVKVKSLRGADVLYLRFNKEVQGISVNINGREASLPKTGGWLRLTLSGMGVSESDLKFVLRTPSVVSFWVMDESPGLPGSVSARPANFIAWYGSDVTLVCRKYTLERSPRS
ncbi:MAG TPA: M28 family peptidase [Candidatus Angelobacter sp.]|jgi:hypothetical protein